jgi:glycosyltransferase involved in cell wall biosynthesis
VYAAGLHRQQPHLYESTDEFVVVGKAHGERLHELGLPRARTSTLPNFLPAGAISAESSADQGRHALVSGRLVEEKGFDTAIAACLATGVPLIVAGEGPDKGRLEQLAAGGDVRFTGRLDRGTLADVRREAAVVLAPSRSEEACPYSVLDAYAAGVPALLSDRGGLPELALDSSAIPATDTHAWAERLHELWRDPQARRERGQQVLERAREQFGEERYHERLLRVYAGTRG